jgi:DNA-binding MarR family transcriptional regulator
MVVDSRVVNSRVVDSSDTAVSPHLDLAYLGFFLGLRVNQLTMDRMRRLGFRGVRESHGYLIQHLIESERSITELARRMEVTQQFASKAVAELAGLGIVVVSGGVDRRAKRVKLSAAGWTLIRKGRSFRKSIQARLIRSVGAPDYAAASAIVSCCLEALGGMAQVQSRRVRAPQ